MTAPVQAPPLPVLLDGSAPSDRSLLGGKAWGVNRMIAMGLPVPPAFALPTTSCAVVIRNGGLTDELRAALRRGIAHIESVTGRRFGSGPAPLLVSVRSGAAASMPGMMDTVLNLGLSDQTAAALEEVSGDPRWVRALRGRFRESYAGIVGPDGAEVPDDPWAQLEGAVQAVFASWESPRAQAYRRHHGLSEQAGTAVTVQAMVFGNLDARSGTGVVFSRNPVNGADEPYGEWLSRAQGEEVVSGIVTPQPLSALATALPEAHADLLTLVDILERDARDVQDVEFTVESGRLWVLQTRTAKRSPQAALRLAVALAEDGLLTRADALGRITPELVARSGLAAGGARAVDASAAIARGEPASPGRGTGIAVGEADEAADLIDAGEDVVLVRPTTSPDDVHGMLGAVAVVTDLGGSTSHAALVSRELGIACVVGCGAGTADRLAGRRVTVDGETGSVFEVSDGAGGEVGAGGPDPVVGTLARWVQAELDAPTPGAPGDRSALHALLDVLHSNRTE